jgi:hypothetical protein
MASARRPGSSSRKGLESIKPGHGRRFGELLVDEAVITSAQLQEALQIQSALADYQPLGQVLVNRGWLTRGQLLTLLRRHRKSARLGELLVSAGHITTEQLERALARQKAVPQPLGYALRGLGFVTETTIREALCAQLHINFFDLDGIDPDPALAKLINERYAVRRRIVPLFRSGQTLVVAVDDPSDVGMIEELQQMLKLRIEIVTATVAQIGGAVTRLYTGRRGPGNPPAQPPSVLIGAVRDQEVADLAATAVGVQMPPPHRQPPARRTA